MAGDDVSGAGGLFERGVRQAQEQSDREHMSDQALIRTAGDPGNHMELQRRLKEAVEKLTTEIVTSRESSDVAAKKLQKLTNLLVVLTLALVGLTVALVYMTVHTG